MSHHHRPYRAPRRTRSRDAYKRYLDAVFVVACFLVLILWATRVR